MENFAAPNKIIFYCEIFFVNYKNQMGNDNNENNNKM